MGCKFIFKCPKCGTSLTSSRGRDCGFVAVIKPMICNDCNQLVEVLVGMCGMDGPTGDPEYDKDLNICPECKGKNLKPWPNNHPCLNCGTNMEMSDEPEIYWD